MGATEQRVPPRPLLLLEVPAMGVRRPQKVIVHVLLKAFPKAGGKEAIICCEKTGQQSMKTGKKKSDIAKEDCEIRCHLVAKIHGIAVVETIQFTKHTNKQTKEKK